MSKIKCGACNTILESKYRHDFQRCSCPNKTFLDGGNDYIRCGGMDMKMILFWNEDRQDFFHPRVEM
jgi:hypothetical protein